jgi:hypothetical protein
MPTLFLGSAPEQRAKSLPPKSRENGRLAECLLFIRIWFIASQRF